MKKWISILLALTLAVSFAACTTKEENSSSQAPASSSDAASSEAAPAEEPPELPGGPEYAAKMKAMLEGTGEFADNPMVTMETTAGTIKIRLFPEESPRAVENFIGLIKKGYYDGVTFHRVIKDFMIQSGDPTGTGAGGESFFGDPFEIEYGYYMWHLRGCLSMANTGMPNSNGSQFYIVQGNNYPDLKDQLPDYGFPQEVIDLYESMGGRPDLDLLSPEGGKFGYTKFGYVTEGMDIVDQIAAVETASDKPVEDVKIIKMTVKE